jgi:hypothetical protein
MVLILILIPCVLQAEILFLKDGSNLVGNLVRIEGDTLYFQPSFGGTLQFSKSDVWRIQFADSDPLLEKVMETGRQGEPAKKVEGPGTLVITFGGISISNKIVVHRKRNYDELERANWIKSSLVVDGSEVAAVIDSTTDKVYRDGPDTIIKNTMKMQDFRVDLDSGTYSCIIIIKNVGASEHKKDFEYAPLDLTLKVENVTIFPQRQTTIEVGKKRGAFRLGMPKLYIKTYR